MRKVPYLLLAAFWLACAEKVIEPPEDLIPKENMVEILHDLALLNATHTSFKSVLENNDIEVMEFLFEKHGIDSLQFATSDRYYASKPLEYQSMYEEVEAKIVRQKNVLEDNAKRKNDSVKKAQDIKRDSMDTLKKDSVQRAN